MTLKTPEYQISSLLHVKEEAWRGQDENDRKKGTWKRWKFIDEYFFMW